MTNSKRKGKIGELEWANFLKDHGFEDARRTQQYSGVGGTGDVIGLDGHHCEVKRVEKLNLLKAMQQAQRDSEGTDNIPIVAHRRNRGEWLVTLRAEDYLELLKSHKDELDRAYQMGGEDALSSL